MALFGARRRVEDLEVELARTQALLAQVGGLDEWQLVQRRHTAEQQLAATFAEEQAARGRITALGHELANLQTEVVETRSEQLLQAAGVYNYVHPLDSAVAYKQRLTHVRGDIKKAVTDRRAVTGSVDWTVNGSRTQGAKMVKDFSTLMLRAYNAEADNCVRTVKPHTLPSVRTRLDKTRLTIAKLGATMSIAIAERYHFMRLHEIELTADYLAKVEAERELIRAQKEAAREEERARRDFERQKAKLLKEQAHYLTAYNRLLAQAAPDPAAVEQLRTQLQRLDADIATVDERAANTRAGYVYVISNIGSFGDQVVKIGMTRRLEPMDRVRELGDASVPFRFDVHALVFSNDAVGLEGRLHASLAQERVNKVNQHREFFRTTPAHVRDLLAQAAGSHLLEFTETAEALEWRASGATATLTPLPPDLVVSPPPSEDAITDDQLGASADVAQPTSGPQLRPGQSVPLLGIGQVRIVLSSPLGGDVELDPVAFLLTADGVVRQDDDMVFYGQPDHPTGAVTLAADDAGSPTALHIRTDHIPDAITEMLLTAQISASTPTVAHAIDMTTGASLGFVDIPAPGPNGLVQIGAVHRSADEWGLLAQPAALDHDLAGLATAAGVTVG